MALPHFSLVCGHPPSQDRPAAFCERFFTSAYAIGLSACANKNRVSNLPTRLLGYRGR